MRGRSGRPTERRKAEIRSAEDIHCWRCGKPLDGTAKWPHPLFVTMGHIIALEDGGDPLDRDNTAPECIACNMGDGARRTNRKRSGKTERKTWRNPNW